MKNMLRAVMSEVSGSESEEEEEEEDEDGGTTAPRAEVGEFACDGTPDEVKG